MPRFRHIFRAGVVFVYAVVFILGFFIFGNNYAEAIIGPNQSPGSGGGLFTVDPNRSIGFGTASSTPEGTFDDNSQGHGYVFTVASTTNPGLALKNLSSGNTFLWSARNTGRLDLYRESSVLPGKILMTVTATGDIGISAFATPTSTARLIVGDTTDTSRDAIRAQYGNITAAIGQFSGTTLAGNISSGSFGSLQGGGNFSFANTLVVGTSTTTGPSNGLYVVGNVGIGTASPNRKFEVGGGVAFRSSSESGQESRGIEITPTTYSGTQIIRTWSSAGGLLIDSANTGTANAGSEIQLYAANGSSGDIIFRGTDYGTAMQDRMIIKGNTGNVGIGTTAPVDKLDVQGGYIRVGMSGGGQFKLVPGASSDTFGIYDADNTAYRLWISNTGNVGIATTTPTTAKLVIAPGAGAAADMGGGRILGVGTPTANSDAANKNYVDSVVGGSGGTWTTSGNDIYNANSGNVGIGTASPAYKLQVNGTSTTPVASFYAGGDRLSIKHDTTADTFQLYHYDDNAVAEQKLALGLGNYLVVDSSGKVFVNRTTSIGSTGGAGGKLQVTGNIDIAGPSDSASQINFWTYGNSNSTHDAYIGINSYQMTIGNTSELGSYYDFFKMQAGKFITSANEGRFWNYTGTAQQSGTASYTGLKMNITETSLGSGTNYLMRLQTGGTDRFTIRNEGSGYFAGNVGVGTTTPSYKLDVVGTSQFSQPVIVGTPTQTSHATTKSYVDSIVGGGSGSGSFATLSVAGTSTLATNTNDRVGIGTVLPSGKLDIALVKSNTPGDDGASIKLTSSANSELQWGIRMDSSNENFAIDRRYGGVWNNALFINRQYGNVGIGTTVPNTGLEIYGAANQLKIGGTSSAIMLVNRGGTNRQGTINFTTADSLNWSMGTADSDLAGDGSEFFIGTTSGGTNPAFWIETNGNVGIGTTAPGATLDVAPTAGNIIVARFSSDSVGSERVILKGGTNLGIVEGGHSLQLQTDGSGDLYMKTDSDTDFNIMNGGLGGTSQLFVLGSSGNVGIATTTPSYKLDVVGTSQFSQPVIVGTPTANSHATTKSYVDSVVTSASTQWTTTSTGIFYNSGNVGIGESSPTGKLEISGGALRLNNSSGSPIAWVDTSSRSAIYETGTASYPFPFNAYSNLVIQAQNSRSIVFSTGATPTSTMVINDVSNVGIGTISPNAKLHVVANGDGNFSGVFEINSEATTISSTEGLKIVNSNATANNYNNIYFADTYDGGATALIGNKISNHANNYGTLEFWTRGSSGGDTRMVITENGNVGIGTTDPQYGKLQIKGDGSAAGGISFYQDAGGTARMYLKSDGGSDFNFHITRSGIDTKGIVINSSGNVGITTTTPSYALDVVGTSQFSQPVIVGTPTQTSHATTKSYVDSMFTGSGQWTTSGGNVYLTSTTQNVGIGTTNPVEDLQVEGDISLGHASASKKRIGLHHSDLYSSSETAIEFAGYNQGNYISFEPYGSEIMRITSSTVGIGTTAPGGRLDVTSASGWYGMVVNTSGIISTVGGDTTYGLRVNHNRFGDDNSSVSYGIYSNNTAASAGNNHTMYGVYGYVKTPMQYSGNSAVGLQGTVEHDYNTNSTVSSGSMTGVSSRISFIDDSGTFTMPNSYGFKSELNVTANKTITNYYGLYLGTKGGSGTVANHWGVYQADTGAKNYFGGNVGIATTTPSYKLDVVGTSQFSQPVIVGTPTQTSHATTKSYVDSMFTGSGQWTTSGGNVYLTSTTQNVGIGTTSPVDRLNIHKSDTSSITVSSNLGSQGGVSSALNLIEGTTGYGVAGSGGGQILYNATDNNLYFNFWTGSQEYQRMIINRDTGNVGIGTTSAGARLHVSGGNIRLDNNRSIEAVNTIDNIVNLMYLDTGNHVHIADSSNMNYWYLGRATDAQILGHTSDYMTFTTASSERMRIDSSGNVGIATTTPLYKLDVVGTSQFSQPVIVGTPTQTSHATTKSYVDSMFTGSGQWTTLGSNVYLTSTTQNVGIGTTSPSSKLVVNISDSGSDDGIVLRNSDTTNNLITLRHSVSQNGSYIWMYDDDGTEKVAIRSYGTSYFSGGNVGIGTTAPAGKLDVRTSGGDGGFTVRYSGDGSEWFSVGAETGVTKFATQGGYGQVGNVDLGARFNIGAVNDSRPSLAVRGYSGGTSDVMRVSSPSVTTGDYFIIKSTGNVGIGTTGPASKLEVSGNLRLGGGSRDLEFSDTSVKIGRETHNLVIQGHSSADTNIIVRAGATENARITNTGNVGIATTTPSYKLDVVGTSQFSQPVIVGTPTANSHATTKSYVDSMFTGSGQWTTSGGNVYLTSTTQNVGIGTTSPIGKLHIGYTTTQRSIILESQSSNYDAIGTISSNEFAIQPYSYFHVLKGYAYTSSNRKFNTGDYVITIDNNNMRLMESGGNVGIGTTSPVQKLDVAGSISLTNNSVIGRYNGSAWEGNVQFANSVGTIIRYGGTDIMSITSGSNVGIATTTPQYKLTVSGTGYFDQPVIVGTPTANSHAATKSYVDSIVGGGAGSGNFTTLTVSGTSTLSGNWQLGGAALGNLNMNGYNIVGVNKITATVIDPIYSIDGVKYATYGSDTIGIKTSVYGKAKLTSSSKNKVLSIKYAEKEGGYLIPGITYSATLDFSKAKRGSDLWLFWQTIKEGENMSDIVVALTPEFDGRAWYEVRPDEKQVVIYGSTHNTQQTTRDIIVSYHLTAPRHDASQWGNLVKDQAEEASFILKTK